LFANNNYQHWRTIMKKYLTLAAFLGAIAFLSVSYLAQAEPEAGAAMTTTTTTSTTTTATAPAAELTGYAKDLAECNTLAAAPSTEGATPSAEEQAAAAHKCLIGKGHTEEMIKAEAEKAKAAETPAAPPAAEEKH
jgi:hypothetical protein